MARASVRGQNIPMVPIQQEETVLVDSVDFSGGYQKDIASRKIPDNAFQELLQFIFTRGRCIVWNGVTSYNLTPPDSDKILNIYSFVDTFTGLNLLRITKGKIYKATSIGWVEITPSGIAANAGTDYDYFTFTVAENRFFFSNSTDPIREIDPVALTYKQLGNAPIYRYLAAGFDRIIGANRLDVTDIPTEIGYCGQRNYDEWDPTVDISAGIINLTTSPVNTSDDITGLYIFKTFLIIPRENSVWLVQHQASATNPFIPYPVLENLGMDTPRTIQRTERGLIWYNAKFNGVYYWEPPNGNVEELSLKLKHTMRYELSHVVPSEIFASYNPDQRTYTLYGVLTGTGITVGYQYNFIEGNWTTVRQNNTTCALDTNFTLSSLTIDELTGTISALAGSINQLGGAPSTVSTMFGRADGTIKLLTPFTGILNPVTEPVNSSDTEAIARWKVIELPVTDSNFNLVRVEFIPYTTGTVSIAVYKDDNYEIGGPSKLVQIGVDDLNKPTLIQIRKSIDARNLAVLAQFYNGLIAELIRFTVTSIREGTSKTGSTI